MEKTNKYLKKLFGLDGKKVLVTGALGQLGKVMCQGFLDAGSIVIGTDLNLDQKKFIKDNNISYYYLDITSKDSVQKLFNELYKNNVLIDVLINNAGVSTFESFEDRSEKSFDWVTDVNLKGTFFCIQEYVKNQKEIEKSGNIINIASVYGIISSDPMIYKEGDRKNSEIYGATKAGIIQMTKYFAVHLAHCGIRVNAISPGGIYNPENPQSKYFINEYSKRNPMGRMGKSNELLGALFYFASGTSSYVTGHNLVVDGGMSCW